MSQTYTPFLSNPTFLSLSYSNKDSIHCTGLDVMTTSKYWPNEHFWKNFSFKDTNRALISHTHRHTLMETHLLSCAAHAEVILNFIPILWHKLLSDNTWCPMCSTSFSLSSLCFSWQNILKLLTRYVDFVEVTEMRRGFVLIQSQHEPRLYVTKHTTQRVTSDITIA